MTDEELALMRDRAEWHIQQRDDLRLVIVSENVLALLAEVDKLRKIVRVVADADNERLLALIEQVATQVATEDTLAYEGDAGDDQRCVLCGGVKGKDGIFEYQHVSDYHEWKHADNCPVTQARALLDQK